MLLRNALVREVITSVERRQQWSAGEEERLVAASVEASVSVVAREAGERNRGPRRRILRALSVRDR
jgi:hypothetical protein